MNWILFKFADGSNPYVAKTEKEAKKIIKKYKNRIKKLDDNFYWIKEERKPLTFPLF